MTAKKKTDKHEGQDEKILGTGAAGDPYNPAEGAPLGVVVPPAPEDVETSSPSEVQKKKED